MAALELAGAQQRQPLGVVPRLLSPRQQSRQLGQDQCLGLAAQHAADPGVLVVRLGRAPVVGEDRGQLIRCPVDVIRIAGRKTQGVVLFRTEEGEKVVSVTRLADETAEGGNGDSGTPDTSGGPADA